MPPNWQGAEIDTSIEYAARIVFCPGSRYGPAKQWNGYKNLIELLPGKQIVILGDSTDSDTAESLESAAPDRVVNLAGKTTIVEACRIIAAAKAVVANDSGLMHLAGYCGTPVVGIFGSTSPTWTRPLGTRVGIAYVKNRMLAVLRPHVPLQTLQLPEVVTPEHVAQLVPPDTSGQARHLWRL